MKDQINNLNSLDSSTLIRGGEQGHKLVQQ